MNIFEQLEQFEHAQSLVDKIDESGMQNISKLAKQYKTATGYFHTDLDGVTSAIAMRTYLERYGIKTTKVIPINYGSSEFSANKPQKGTLNWLVDFAHGKPFVDIHTDHHDAQAGVTGGTSTDFSHAAANVGTISAKISPSELFPSKDLDVIKMVDSAGYAKAGINPDQVMNAAFGYDKTIDVTKNHIAMGLVVNKLLLANKGKKNFLTDLVMQANPSLTNMFVTIVRLAKQNGFKPSNVVVMGTKNYVEQQKNAMVKPNIDPKNLGSGQSTIWGNTIVQYGGGSMMGARTYDRYTPFKLYPDADYLIMIWSMGLIQVSKNPFKSGKNPYDLGKLIMGKVMGKWKSKMQREKVTLGTVKRVFEMDIKGNTDAMGFSFGDFVSLFKKDQVQGIDIEKEGGYNEFIKKITNMPYSKLSYKQKELLDRISINYWDLVVAQSGGHKDITNVQLGSFLGKGYMDDWVKPMASDIAQEMKDKKLEN